MILVIVYANLTILKTWKDFTISPIKLDEKLKNKIDMSTIDWIWDEISIISTIGQLYSDKYRPLTPERLKEAEESPYSI